MTDRTILVDTFHDFEAAVKAARTLYPGAPDDVVRLAASDFLVHVRELRRNGISTGPAPNADPMAVPSACPACGARVIDQRTTKRNPRAPDVKCSRRECPWAIWGIAKP
jgi:hypothetical protein